MINCSRGCEFFFKRRCIRPFGVRLVGNIHSVRMDVALISSRNIDNSESAWHIEPFMTVGEEEIRVGFMQIQGHLTSGMGAIEDSENTIVLTETIDSFIGKQDTRKRGQDINNSYTDGTPGF